MLLVRNRALGVSYRRVWEIKREAEKRSMRLDNNQKIVSFLKPTEGHTSRIRK